MSNLSFLIVLFFISLNNPQITTKQAIDKVNKLKESLTPDLYKQFPLTCALLNKELSDAHNLTQKVAAADTKDPRVIDKINFLMPIFNIKIGKIGNAIKQMENSTNDARRLENLLRNIAFARDRLKKIDDNYNQLPETGFLIPIIKQSAKRNSQAINNSLRLLPKQAFTLPDGLDFAEESLQEHQTAIEYHDQVLRESRYLVIDH